MSVQTKFYDWARSPLDWSKPPFETCSPNLIEIRMFLQSVFGVGQYLGCEGDREIRTGGAISSHAFGAAFDWRYPNGTADMILNVLIDNSAELGIDAIHDYLRSRIWHAGRTSNTNDAHTLWWRAQTPSVTSGMGQAWANYFHIETHLDDWFNSTPIVQRLAPPPPPPPSGNIEDMKPVLYRDVRFQDVWLVYPTVTDLSPKLAAYYESQGAVKIEDKHDSMLACLLHQVGRSLSSLLPA